MLQSLLFFLGYAALFQFISIGWIRSLYPRIGGLNSFVLSQISGFVIALWVSSIVARSSGAVQLSLALLLLVGVMGLVLMLYKKRARVAGSVKEPWHLAVFSAFLVSFLYTFLGSGSVTSPSLAFRVGPDSFGWSRATYTFCSGDTVEALTSRVTQSLNGTELIDSFQRSPAPGVTSINSISSFSDQISAEFLIGADRTGIPMLTGSLCSLLGTETLYSSVGGLIAWAFGIMSLIAFLLMKSRGSSDFLAAAVSVGSSLSVGILSVTLEGGVGQLVTLPLLSYAIYSLYSMEFNRSHLLAAFVFLLAGSSSTYIDLLYFAIPFLGLAVVSSGRFRAIALPVNKTLMKYVSIGLLTVMPAIPSIVRLSSSFVSNNGAGGWHQGDIFLPSNLFSITSVLPLADYQIYNRDSFGWAIEIAASVLIVTAIGLVGLRRSTPFLIVLAGYVIVSFSIYQIGMDNINNYRIWKYSMYASALMPLLYAELFAKARVRYSNRGRRILETPSRFLRGWKVAEKSEGVRSLAMKGAASVLLILTLVTAFNWAKDWQITKDRTVSQQAIAELNTLVPVYDIQVLSQSLDAAQFAVASTDLRLGTSARYPIVQRSLPYRPFMILIPLTSDCARECALSKWGGSVLDPAFIEISGLRYFLAFREAVLPN